MESGNVHLHAFLAFGVRKRFAWLREQLQPDSYLGVNLTAVRSRGRDGLEDARQYCMGKKRGQEKAGFIKQCWEFGEFSAPGSGGGAAALALLEVEREARADPRGAFRSVARSFDPMLMRLKRNVLFTVKQYYEPRPYRTTCVLLWGETGLGKSSLCRWWCEQLGWDHYRITSTSSGGITWWDGYDGQKVVWVDELDHKTFSLELWKELANDGALWLEQKGSRVLFTSLLLLACSNDPPERLFGDFGLSHISAIRRRWKIVKLEGPEYVRRRGGDGPPAIRDERYWLCFLHGAVCDWGGPGAAVELWSRLGEPWCSPVVDRPSTPPAVADGPAVSTDDDVSPTHRAHLARLERARADEGSGDDDDALPSPGGGVYSSSSPESLVRWASTFIDDAAGVERVQNRRRVRARYLPSSEDSSGESDAEDASGQASGAGAD